MRSCFATLLILLVALVMIELCLSVVSDRFGPDIDDYCTKENLVKISEPALFERRQQEVLDRDSTVSDGWKTVVTEKKFNRFLYNHIRSRSAVLWYQGKEVAEVNHFTLARDNIVTVLGIAPSGGDSPCRKHSEYFLSHRSIVEPFNDHRFSDPEYQ